MIVEKLMKVVSHEEGENPKETVVYMEIVDDDYSLSIALNNEEAKSFPVNSRVKLTIEPA